MAALVAVAPTSRADTWLVPAQVPTIAAGLDSAAAGDTVSVSCGTYFESGLVLKTGVTLRSADGTFGCVTLDGGGADRVLEADHVSDVRVEGFTIQQGTAGTGTGFERAGGALRCDSAGVAVSDCLFTGNTAAFGGAIGARRSAIEITDCIFLVNAANGPNWAAGGGLYAQECTGDVLRCDFLENSALAVMIGADGGGMFLDDCQLLVDGCDFTGNDAQAGAGGIYSFFRDSSTIRDCEFQGNTAGAGGALYFETSRAAVVDCRFNGNEGANGGAMFLDKQSTSSIRDCTFDGNQANPFSGGAVECWRSTPVFERCRFLNNTATVRGGAFSLHLDADVQLQDCFLAGNAAGSDGGALWSSVNSQATITGCTIAANSTGGTGGGLHATGTSSLVVDASILAFATTGEAIACSGSGTVSLSCTDLFGNAGGDWVGCVAAQAGLNGNFSADPQFCDLPGHDDRVTLPGSPALPANNSCGTRIGSGGSGCGCPVGATLLVPGDQPTIAAALAAAVPGDVIGICSGTYVENVSVVSGVHLRGVRSDLVTIQPDAGAAPTALIRAVSVGDSTQVSDLTLDGLGMVAQVVSAESTSTGLQLARNRITGGSSFGVLVDADSRVRIGGALPLANDLFGNGGATPVQVRNENTVADSLDALLNYWGTQEYDQILAQIQGPVRSCPITDATHTLSLCAPLSAVDVPSAPRAPGLSLSIGPSPFDETTRIRFVLPTGAPTRVTVHDVSGRLVRVLADRWLPAGPSALDWPGRDGAGRAVAPGVYFIRLEAGSVRQTGRVVRIR